MRLLTGLSALLLTLGFVVGQFTGASLARRNTERLQAQLDQVERTLAAVEGRLDEQREEQALFESALVRIENQRRRELELDRATLETMIGSADTARTAVHGDLDDFDADRRAVTTVQVRRMIDRFVGEQTLSMQHLLTSQSRRLGLPDQVKRPASSPASDLPEDTDGVAARDENSGRAAEATLPPANEETIPEESVPEEPSVVEMIPSAPAPPAPAPAPAACRPKNAITAESATVTVASEPERYLTPPRRHGLLFISPSQPRRMDPTRISDSDSIPLPPR